MDPQQSMFHTFATEGFAAWAELFLEAIHFHYGDRVHVLLDGYGLSDDAVATLTRIHGNLRIRNQPEKFEELADKAGVDMATVQRWKKEIEEGATTNENFWFKSFISDDQRYRSMDNVLNYASSNGFSYLVHADVDIYIRDRLDRIGPSLENHDLGLFIRQEITDTKPLGAFLAFRVGAGATSFVDTWMAEIDSVPFTGRKRGWGQIIIKRALEQSHGARVLNFNDNPRPVSYSKTFERDADLWLGSNSRGRGPIKVGPRMACWEDFKARLPRIEPRPMSGNPIGRFFRRLARP